jgi:DNA end-binding protein Ku
MARALWKGSIAFGLVSIPIELHTAVRITGRVPHAAMRRTSRRFDSNGCASRWHARGLADLIKGFEFEKGHFVVLTKEDFRPPPSKRRGPSTSWTS